MRIIAREERGALVLISDANPGPMAASLTGTRKDGGRPSLLLRDNGIGAQILVDLGISRLILLSNTPRTIVGAEGYGLHIVGQRPVSGCAEWGREG